MVAEGGAAWGAIVTVEVKGDPSQLPRTFRGFGGMPASRRAFWDAVRSREQRDAGLMKRTDDEYEEHTIKVLASRLTEKSRSQNRAMADVRVAILGYGSAKVGVAWFGPDVLDVLMTWVAECLGGTFVGVDFVPVDIEPATEAEAEGKGEAEAEGKGEAEAEGKGAKRSIVAQALAWALKSLPTNPLTLLLVCLFVIGAFLVEQSERSVDGLIEKRTALIEKLAANRQDPERAWGAAFTALATPACECDAVPGESPPQPPPRGIGPKTAAKGPSCCQQLASAVSSAVTFLASRGVLDAGSDIGTATIVGR